MKIFPSRKPMALLAGFLYGLLLLPAVNQAALQSMDDEAMSDVNAQALFMASHETRVSTGVTGANGLTYDFYKMGLDVQLDLNTNISELKLGEDASGTDLWIRNLAMGCTANAANACVDSSTATQLRPFTLLRPFIQIAVKGDSSPATREVVGVRLGAQHATGPFSAGNFLSFSGYLQGTANLEMQEMGGGTGPGGTTRNNPAVDTLGDPNTPSGCSGNVCRGVALTSTSNFKRSTRYPVPGSNTTNIGWNFGFDNQSLVAGLAQTDQFLVKFNAIVKNNLLVTASGRRTSQALIQGAALGSVVDELMGTVEITATTNFLGVGISNDVLPALKTSIGDNLKNQLATDLGVNGTNGGTGAGSDHANLNAYKIPFNLENFHSVIVDSNLFGLSFQKEDGVLYPGYAAAMNRGWSMYLPNAFTLDISNPTVQFVANIGNGSARAGNIIGLPALGGAKVFDNCWGAAVFC